MAEESLVVGMETDVPAGYAISISILLESFILNARNISFANLFFMTVFRVLHF